MARCTASVISHPPPNARPLTAAITGFLKASSRAVMRLAAPDEVPHGRIATATDAACEFVDIGARGERAFAGAGQDHGACIGVRLDFIQCRHQAIDQIVIQRIELVGAVERNKRDPVIDFEQHGVGHLGFSGSVGSLRAP